jgi:glycerophosphoryl diester phosphodiesterase
MIMKTTIAYSRLLLATALLCSVIQADECSERIAGLNRSQVHRGGGVVYPDNAIESFLYTWGNGCAPEADARLTKDGIAIALHDPTLRRTSKTAPEAIRDTHIAKLNWSEIKDVDVGSKWDKKYSSYRIATMDSVFAAMKDRPERLLYLDEKGAPPKMMAEMSAKYGVQGQVFYCSSNWRKVVEWSKFAPEGRSMVWLHGAWPKDFSDETLAKAEASMNKTIAEMEAIGFKGITQIQLHTRTNPNEKNPIIPSEKFIRETIKRLHKYGVKVNGADWRRGKEKEVYLKMWDMGFDSFTTDYPEVMFEAIREITSKAK